MDEVEGRRLKSVSPDGPTNRLCSFFYPSKLPPKAHLDGDGRCCEFVTLAVVPPLYGEHADVAAAFSDAGSSGESQKVTGD